MRLENGDYLQLCYLDFMLLPMYLNTDYSLLCTLRVYPQSNVSASSLCPDLLGAIQHKRVTPVSAHFLVARALPTGGPNPCSCNCRLPEGAESLVVAVCLRGPNPLSSPFA